MKIKFQSFRTKILWWNMIVITLVLLFFDAVFYTIAKEHFTEHTINALKVIAEDIYLDDIAHKRQEEIVLRSDKYEFTIPDVMIQISKNNTIIVRSSTLTHQTLPLETKRNNAVEQRVSPLNANEPILLYTDTMGDSDEYTVQVATTMKPIEEELKDVLYIFIVLNPLTLCFIFLLSRKMLKDVVQPMIMMIQSVHEISASDLSKRIPSVGTNDEFSHLAQTFNTMLNKLETSFTQVKRFSDNVSHELKTPLTAIRLHSEIALKKDRSATDYQTTLTTINHEAKKLQAIIDSLLLMAKMDNEDFEASFEMVDVDSILLEAFDDSILLAHQKGIILSVESLEPLSIKGVASLLLTAFFNLINNAIKYTPAGKKVIVSLKNNCVMICDEGIGIHEKDLPNIFNRFFRIDSGGEKGYGLGLSIAKKILTLHHASISIKSKLKEGTTIIIAFDKQP